MKRVISGGVMLGKPTRPIYKPSYVNSQDEMEGISGSVYDSGKKKTAITQQKPTYSKKSSTSGTAFDL